MLAIVLVLGIIGYPLPVGLATSSQAIAWHEYVIAYAQAGDFVYEEKGTVNGVPIMIYDYIYGLVLAYIRADSWHPNIWTFTVVV